MLGFHVFPRPTQFMTGGSIYFKDQYYFHVGLKMLTKDWAAKTICAGNPGLVTWTL